MINRKYLAATVAVASVAAAAVALPATAHAAPAMNGNRYATATASFSAKTVTEGNTDTATLHLSECMRLVSAEVEKGTSFTEISSRVAAGGGTTVRLVFPVKAGTATGSYTLRAVFGQPCQDKGRGLQQVDPARGGAYKAGFTVKVAVQTAGGQPGSSHNEGN